MFKVHPDHRGTLFLLLLLLLSGPIRSSAQSSELLQEGWELYRKGAYPEALQIWQNALREETPNASTKTELYLRIASAHQALGDYASAYNHLQHAEATALESADITLQTFVYSQAGDILLALQRPAAARRQLEKAVKLARSQTNPTALAHALNNAGNFYSSREDYAKARKVYAEIAAMPEVSLDTRFQAGLNQSRTLLLLKKPREAEKVLRGLRGHSALQHPDYLIKYGELLLRLAASLENNKASLMETVQILQKAARSGDQRTAALALGYLGNAYDLAGDSEKAAEAVQGAIFLSQRMPDLLYQWEWYRGRLLHKKNELAAAEQAYRVTLEHLNPIRSRLLIGLRHASRIFAERISPVYYDLADVLLQQAQNTSDKDARNELLHAARDVLEELKRAELQDYFRDECVTPRHSTRLDTLSDDTAVIYPMPLRERLEILLSLKGELSSYQVDVSAETLRETVVQFQRNIQARTKWSFVRQGKDLYDWLVKPFENKLKEAGIKTLVFVPDSSLRMIPPAALFDGKQYLIEHYAVVSVPGLDLTDPRALPRENTSILLNGLSKAVQDFSALPNVPEEIEHIKTLYQNSDVLMDQQYLVGEVSNVLQQSAYSIVHIASHGQFQRDPEETFLLAYDDKISLDRLQNLLSYNRYREQAVELLTLSACQTAVGDEKAALGLAGVALKAGARSALASLWFVNDESTSQLMQSFYQNLQNPEINKAEALRLAQLMLIKQKNFSHPAFWSPFLLIGNWL